MRKHHLLILVIFSCFSFGSFAQNDSIIDGYQVFYYPSGQKASEGLIRNGKPDAYWIAYYPSGIKKAEGNRKNFLLDSTWIFYNQLGDTAEKIDYLLGKKNGYSCRYGYLNDRIGKERMILLSKELYLNDKLEGVNYYYYSDGKLRETVKYRNGQRDGIAFQYDKDSLIIAVKDYRKDYLVQSERINRIDSLGKKQGLWRSYFPDGRIRTEAFYRDNLLAGIYKEFNEKGALQLSLNYRNGNIEQNLEGIEKEVKIQNRYDENDRLTFSGAFIDSIPVGIHRYYNQANEVVDAMVYNNNGVLLSKGIINNEGKRQGKTSFFYDDGKIQSRGDFNNNMRTGKWQFYFRNGKLEQEGNYRNDLAEGQWIWYFQGGEVKREEEFLNGKEDGNYTEYDQLGNIITRGSFVEGEKEGEWEYKVGDHSEKGKYVTGLRDGPWKYYYNDEKLQFEGNYVQGNLDGTARLFYQDGNLMEEQYYGNGIRQRTWRKYDDAGNLLLQITYEDDQEVRINGEKIGLDKPDVKLIK